MGNWILDDPAICVYRQPQSVSIDPQEVWENDDVTMVMFFPFSYSSGSSSDEIWEAMNAARVCVESAVKGSEESSEGAANSDNSATDSDSTTPINEANAWAPTIVGVVVGIMLAWMSL